MSVRVSVDYSICTRSVAVAKKADRTAYDVWYNCTRIELRTTYGITVHV